MVTHLSLELTCRGKLYQTRSVLLLNDKTKLTPKKIIATVLKLLGAIFTREFFSRLFPAFTKSKKRIHLIIEMLNIYTNT